MYINEAGGSAMLRAESVAPGLELSSKVDISTEVLGVAHAAARVPTAARRHYLVRLCVGDRLRETRLARRARLAWQW